MPVCAHGSACIIFISVIRIDIGENIDSVCVSVRECVCVYVRHERRQNTVKRTKSAETQSPETQKVLN